MTEFTQREQAILIRVEELRNSGQQEQLDELLASIENGETELIEDGSIDSLWANVVRSRKITTDMITAGRIIGDGGMTIIDPRGMTIMTINGEGIESG